MAHARRDVGFGCVKRRLQRIKSLDARIAASNLTSLACYRHFLEATAAALIPLEAALEDSNVNAVVEDWQERAYPSDPQ